MGEFNVNKSTGGLEQTAGMPETYPAEQVMMSDGTTSVEDAISEVTSVLTGLKISYDELLYKKSIPTDPTSYPCNWKNYDFLIISTLQYNNRTSSLVINTKYFSTTTSTTRPFIKDINTNKTYQIYKNTDTSVYLVTDSTSENTGVVIEGIRLTN